MFAKFFHYRGAYSSVQFVVAGSRLMNVRVDRFEDESHSTGSRVRWSGHFDEFLDLEFHQSDAQPSSKWLTSQDGGHHSSALNPRTRSFVVSYRIVSCRIVSYRRHFSFTSTHAATRFTLTLAAARWYASLLWCSFSGSLLGASRIWSADSIWICGIPFLW